jgi:hypothetical protein
MGATRKHAFEQLDETTRTKELAHREKARLEELLRALRSNSSEMGTRVVRHIVRDLDSTEDSKGRIES